MIFVGAPGLASAALRSSAWQAARRPDLTTQPRFLRTSTARLAEQDHAPIIVQTTPVDPWNGTVRFKSWRELQKAIPEIEPSTALDLLLQSKKKRPGVIVNTRCDGLCGEGLFWY